MKIIITLILLFFWINLSYTQNIIVIDSLNKEIVPYATIQIIKTNKGLYTNQDGKFSLTEIISDSIRISHIAYKSLKIKKSQIKDTIFLTPNTDNLSEIKIVTGKSKKKTIGYIKKKKNLSWFIKGKTELATLIRYKKKYKSAYINKILIPIGKKSLNSKSYPDFNSIFRVSIYSHLNKNVDPKSLLKSILVKCNQNSPKIIELDISDEFIIFPKEGIFIGIEMIGQLDEKDNLIFKKNNSILPSFQFTEKKNKNIYTESFIKSIFFNNNWENIYQSNKFNDTVKYNLGISLELLMYE